MDRFHSDLMLDNPNSDDDDSSDLLEREFRQGSNLEDIFFQDLSPGNSDENKLGSRYPCY
jgi:hypothetical protein